MSVGAALGTPGAARIALGTLAAGLRPPPPMSVSQWIEDNIVLIDGARAGQNYSFDGAPYLREIADCLGDDHPCNLVTVRKAQQTGASILALAWMLFIADREPANVLYGCPGIDFLRDLNGQKLQPLIDAWQKRIKRTVIVPQTSRSGSGSTTYEKRFPGGYIALGNANSVMDLSSKTTKKGVKDEFSKWSDIPGYGDPDDLFRGRFTAFRRTKDWKILEISTPEIDSGDDTGEHAAHCRIDRSFRRSDQRFWNVQCPECQRLFVYEPSGLALDREHPHRTRYRHSCGHHLSEAERVYSLRHAESLGGGWIPMVEEDGRHPGFHVDAFISLMMSFEAIAEETLGAERKGTEQARKGLSNLVHGRPYKMRGDAPDHRRLMERRETLTRFHVPAAGLLLTAAADVQMRGIYYEVVAHAPDRQTWLVDAGYIPGEEGETADPHSAVYKTLLARTVDRAFPDAFGKTRRIDALGIDTGYLTNSVYGFVRRSQRINQDMKGLDLILALDGRDGWHLPAIGAARAQDVDLDGGRIRDGVSLWPVGTWSLKSTFFANLHKLGIRSGAALDPPGLCHFGEWVDETYFRQVTAEHLVDIIERGVVTGRKWKPTGDNHWLDTRIYNMALAEYLGLSSNSPEEWAALARRRGLPESLSAPDLFSIVPAREVEGDAGPAPTPYPEPPEPEPAPVQSGGSDWFGSSAADWFDR